VAEPTGLPGGGIDLDLNHHRRVYRCVGDRLGASLPEPAAGDQGRPGMRPGGLGQKRGQLGARNQAQRVGATDDSQPSARVSSVAAARTVAASAG
jgi:hypothetical protein